MPIVGPKLLDCDEGILQMGTSVGLLRKRVKDTVAYLPKKKSPDHSLLVAVYALRKLSEAELEIGGDPGCILYQDDVDEWRDAYFEWIEKHKKKISEEYFEDIKEMAQSEFDKLREIATPGGDIW